MKKKIIKKILIISDDFDSNHKAAVVELLEDGKFYYSDIENTMSFHVTFAENFKIPYLRRYHAILIDYGMVGDFEKDALSLILKAVNLRIPVAWVGGLYDHYNNDAKSLYPKLRWLHNLPTSSINCDNIKGMLYSIFSKK